MITMFQVISLSTHRYIYLSVGILAVVQKFFTKECLLRVAFATGIQRAAVFELYFIYYCDLQWQTEDSRQMFVKISIVYISSIYRLCYILCHVYMSMLLSQILVLWVCLFSFCACYFFGNELHPGSFDFPYKFLKRVW